jgi:hypothetical protein
MDAMDLLTQFGAEYGLLPVYALIIGWAGFSANSVRHLLMVLGILTGVYVTMFRAFDLKKDLDIFGLSEHFGLSHDAANGVAAALYVFGIGFAVYGLKRLALRRKAASAAQEET